MSDDFIPFWRLLVLAENQLQEGTEPDAMEETARALAKRRPGSLIAESLTERADYLRMMRCQSSPARAEFLGIIPRTGALQATLSAAN